MKSFIRGLNLFVVLLVSFIVVAGCGKKGKSDDAVVATVSGTVITYGEIKVDPDSVAMEGETLTTEQADDRVFKGELDNLLALLKKSVVDAKVKELGLTASDVEVGSNFDSDAALAGITDESVANMKKRKILIYEALVQYAEAPDKADAIYANKLASVYAKNEWDLYKSVYDAKQDLERFKPEPNLPGSLSEMKATMSEDIRKKLINYKLKKAIFPNITISDESVKEFYESTVRGREVKPEFEQVKNAIPVFLMSMHFFEECKNCMEDWASGEIQSDKVIIKDKKYKMFIKAN